jgi:hypothetical protein
MTRFETDPVRVCYICSACGGRRDLATENTDNEPERRIIDCTGCKTIQQFYKTEAI